MSFLPALTQPVNLEGGGRGGGDGDGDGDGDGNGNGNGFSVAFGGLYLSFKRIDLFGFLSYFNFGGCGTLQKRVRSNIYGNNNTIVLVNSFWGLEKPRLFVPPNIMMIGPIMPPLPSKPDFSTTHPELHIFLTEARNENRKILLVTTGSLVRLEEWLVKLLYNALRNIKLNDDYGGVAIVWSLKQEQQKYISINLNDKEEHNNSNNKFHFSSWLPQPSLLASDYIDGVITHCGWGGTLECIAGGKPIGTFTFILHHMAKYKVQYHLFTFA
jgi:hypothetical protein